MSLPGPSSTELGAGNTEVKETWVPALGKGKPRGQIKYTLINTRGAAAVGTERQKDSPKTGLLLSLSAREEK